MKKTTFLTFAVISAFLIDFYISIAFKKAFDNKLIFYGYWVIHIIYYILLGYGIFFGKSSTDWGKFILISLAVLYIPKIFIFLFLILEDIGRVFVGLYSLTQPKPYFPERRKFISQVALAVASVPFAAVIHGIIFGKYDFRVIRQVIYFKDLPSEFDGFTITQISDIHSGSFDNPEKVAYGIDMINQQDTDMFVFTGDLVNNDAVEMLPYMDLFKKIRKHPYGNFSIMGNHDYGEYKPFSTDKFENERLKIKNHELLLKIHQQLGFDLLLNEHRVITKNGQSINLVGVENWGASEHFPKRGNLQKATEGIDNNSFNVLLSHDPSHFDFKEALFKTEIEKRQSKEKPVVKFEKMMHLTLSGHTHGAQMGIEIPGFKWSPVKYFYDKWAGLYEEAGRYLYVNRGFGFLGFPGRVGIWPEITVLELRKKA